ncbi:hypothetical protein COT29_02595 [Candidatus Micrarchaeota archaeon CG08_land_8_20_14_0_20_59_11]|nr:MAG: hypothetical protein COT29_02595 [Candidatus Micrarchaeota archaeon CG08_land_8_20_14_0_20_59_11]
MAQLKAMDWKAPKKEEGMGAKLFEKAKGAAEDFPWNVWVGSIPGLGTLSAPFQIKELVDASGKIKRQRSIITAYMLRDISEANRGMGPTANVARISPAQAEQAVRHFTTRQANARAAVQIANMKRRPPIPQSRGALFIRRWR